MKSNKERQADPTQSIRFVPNVPNVLTLVRFCLIPVFVLLYGTYPLWACGLFVLAEITDILDGYIARKNNLVTGFGKLMDPLADKLMVLTVCLCLYFSGRLPVIWPYFLFGKELTLILGGVFLLKGKNTVVHADIIGKVAAVMVFLVFIAAFFREQIPPVLFDVLQYAALAVSACAVCWYAYVHLIKPRKFKQ